MKCVFWSDSIWMTCVIDIARERYMQNWWRGKGVVG